MKSMFFERLEIKQGGELDEKEVAGVRQIASQAEDLWPPMDHPNTGGKIEAIRTKGSDIVDRLYVRYLEPEGRG